MAKQLFIGLLPLLLAGALNSSAQTTSLPLVTGSYQQLPLRQFMAQLATTTGYRFFYDPAVVDSLRVSVQAQGEPLSRVLQRALQGTTLRFAVDSSRQRQVFITEGPPIMTELAAGFFQREPDQAGTPPSRQPALLPEQPGDEGRNVISSATKVYNVGQGSGTGQATLAGIVREAATGAPVVGANVFVEVLNIGTSTAADGSYALVLPAGRHEVRVRGIGLKATKRQVLLRGNGRLDIETQDDVNTLQEVLIQAEKAKNITSTQMGVDKLDIKTMRQVPTAFGEVDILRVVMTLPGVKTVGEGNTGLNVRGGATDQNLILFNGATIYNPSHLFGFFSAFNPDVVRSVELYKGAIPARYGGRLSSVLEIQGRPGDAQKYHVSGGVGPLTSRLAVEGPIVKDKASFIVGGRSSYSNWLLHLLPNEVYKQSSASFSDLSGQVDYALNKNNSVTVTGYYSTDKFQLGRDTAYHYVNRATTAKWQHVFSPKLSGVLTAANSFYRYDITSKRDPSTASQLTYAIDHSEGRADFSYLPTSKHNVDFGVSAVRYQVSPGGLEPSGAESLIRADVLEREQGLESAVYVSDRIELTPRLSVSVGLRYSLYNALGPREVYRYLPGQSKTLSTLTDTVRYAPGKVLATYHGPEYRASARYSLSEHASVKVGFNRTRQYIHMLSNTTAMSPTDIWKLSDGNTRPQVGDQYSLGYYRNFRRNSIETSVEAYYKATRDFVDYKGGAVLLLNRHIETDIVNAVGRAYGVEMLVRKLSGKINGWVSYTYSRTLVQVNQGTPADRINGGQYYPSNFDKPHDFSLVGNYRFSHRISTSLNVTYSTGRPITLPLAKYYNAGATRVYYSLRNAYRVPDYFRMDFGLNLEGNHKVQKLAHSSWTFGVYNLTGRQNPYSVYFRNTGGQIKGYQLSIFGQPIPTVVYNFKF